LERTRDDFYGERKLLFAYFFRDSRNPFQKIIGSIANTNKKERNREKSKPQNKVYEAPNESTESIRHSIHTAPEDCWEFLMRPVVEAVATDPTPDVAT
jgi:hypothetical protein